MIRRGDRILAAVISAIATGGLMWSLVEAAELSVQQAALFGPLLQRYILNPMENRLQEKRLEEGRTRAGLKYAHG